MLLRTDKNVVCNQGRSQNLSAWALLSAAGAQKWGMCKWDQLVQHTWHKCTTVLQFDKCTEPAGCSSFLCSHKELLCPWLQISDSGAKWKHGPLLKDLSRAWKASVLPLWHELGAGAAMEAGLQCVRGIGMIAFPESLALQCSNGQVSALAYKVGSIFVPPKVQLLTLRQLLFPVRRNPVCSIQ